MKTIALWIQYSSYHHIGSTSPYHHILLFGISKPCSEKKRFVNSCPLTLHTLYICFESSNMCQGSYKWYASGCGHIGGRGLLRCARSNCTSPTVPKVCETGVCRKCRIGDSIPYLMELREKLKTEFELEKAKYDQRWDEIAERECGICSEDVTNLAQAQRLDELCLQLTDDSCHCYIRFRKQKVRERSEALRKAIFKVPIQLYLGP
jgi:hypothetical protein